MSNSNINVVVSGPRKDYTSTYKTYILRGGVPFADQVIMPDTKYVIKYDFDIGGGAFDLDFSNADTHTVAEVTYYYIPFIADGSKYTLMDNTLVFVDAEWNGLSVREIKPKKGNLFMIASITGGLHKNGYSINVVTVPKNCILEFDGGTLNNGTIIGQNTAFFNVGDVEIWGENLIKQGTWKELHGGIQSDWNQTDQTALDYIKNKPDIYTKQESDNKYAPKSDTKRIEALEQAVGSGGSVDSRIASANAATKAEVIGGASSIGNTLKKLEDRLSPVENAVGTGGSVDNRINNAVNDAKTELNGTINDTKQELEESIGSEEEARIFADNEHNLQIANRYTKEEVNNIVSRTPETDVIVIDIPAASQSDIAGWLDANTPSGTDPETGRSVRANKLYRVPGPTNETYSEWAWDGTAYILLANKDYGIDNTPKYDSDNSVKSKGVALADEISIQSLVQHDIIRSAFCKLSDDPITLTSGQYIPTDIAELGKVLDTSPQQASETTSYAMISCSPGDLFAIYNFNDQTEIIGGYGARLYCFLDSSNKVLSVAPPEFILPYNKHFVISAPLNSEKVIFQARINLVRFFEVDMKNKIITKILASNNPFVDGTHFRVPTLIIEYNNETVLIDPVNYNEVIELTGNGYIYYNYLLNRVSATTSYSDIKLYDTILIYRKDGQWTDSISGYLSPGFKSNHIFDVYSAIDATFTANSVTIGEALGVIGGSLISHYIVEDGQPVVKTFTFTENGYLVYNSSTKTAEFKTSSSSINQNDFIWIYYRNGKIVGGLLYESYLSSIRNSGGDSGSKESETVVVKRADQLSKVSWYAKNPVPTDSAIDGIPIGSHLGIPYTSCMEIDKFVGYDVSLETFMTAANNPYSLLYTEYLKTSPEHPYGVSDYGFVYHGTRATIGGYMGIVCNIFALYSVGYDIPYDTGNWKHLAKKGVFKKADYQNAKAFDIGTIIIEPGHASIITNVTKDADGSVISVDWSESGYPFVRTTTMTVAQANARLQSIGGTVYRLRDKNLLYDESIFLPDSGSVSYEYNNDICTFAGDLAVFREGQIIYLNYNLESIGNWTHIELRKDDDIVGTYAIDVSSHKYALTNLNLGYGQYKARMTDGNGNYSDYTYFQIIDANVSYAYNNQTNIIRVVFSSEFGEPLFVRLCTIDGGPICIIPLTEDDKRRGYVEFNPIVEGNSQGYSIREGGTYLKVYFSSEYGRVTNAPILTEL